MCLHYVCSNRCVYFECVVMCLYYVCKNRCVYFEGVVGVYIMCVVIGVSILSVYYVFVLCV